MENKNKKTQNYHDRNFAAVSMIFHNVCYVPIVKDA